jgi:hypothetical protein
MIKRFFVYRLSISCMVLVLAIVANAQSNFLYIQSENSQPYYIQFKGNTYGSNGKGYLFIPQLPNGNHSIVISFPGNQYGEYIFSFTIANKPKGYALRITQDGEWMLMDMVTTELVRGIVSEMPASRSAPKQVQKLSERSNETGFDQKYVIRNGSKIDTIAVFIPAIAAAAVTAKPTGAATYQQRIAMKATATDKLEAKPSTPKVKVPLVPEAYGTGMQKKPAKQ